MVIGLALGVSLLAGPFALALILQVAVLDQPSPGFWWTRYAPS